MSSVSELSSRGKTADHHEEFTETVVVPQTEMLEVSICAFQQRIETLKCEGHNEKDPEIVNLTTSLQKLISGTLRKSFA
jgi:hypothetical protein